MHFCPPLNKILNTALVSIKKYLDVLANGVTEIRGVVLFVRGVILAGEGDSLLLVVLCAGRGLGGRGERCVGGWGGSVCGGVCVCACVGV